jgi:hypothetical protein
MDNSQKSTQFFSKLFPTFEIKNDFTKSVKKLLKYHQIITSAPGLTCSIHVDPSFYYSLLGNDDVSVEKCSTSDRNNDQNDEPNNDERNIITNIAVGYSDLITMTKLSSSDTMMIGSITKYFTSILVGKFIELGLLKFTDLDTPICQFFLQNDFDEQGGSKNDQNNVNFIDSNYWMRNIKYIFGYHELNSINTDDNDEGLFSSTIIEQLDTHYTPFFEQISRAEKNEKNEKNKTNLNQNDNNFDANELKSLLPESFQEITIGKLLSHTSGIRDYNFADEEDNCTSDYLNTFMSIFQFIYDPLLDNVIETTTIASKKNDQNNNNLEKIEENRNDEKNQIENNINTLSHYFTPQTPSRKYTYTTFGFCLLEVVLECVYFNHKQCELNNFKKLHKFPNIDPSDNFVQNLKYNFLQQYYSQFCTFSQIIDQIIFTPLNLPQIQHEMLPSRSLPSSFSPNSVHKAPFNLQNRAGEHTRAMFPRCPKEDKIKKQPKKNLQKNLPEKNEPTAATPQQSSVPNITPSITSPPPPDQYIVAASPNMVKGLNSTPTTIIFPQNPPIPPQSPPESLPNTPTQNIGYSLPQVTPTATRTVAPIPATNTNKTLSKVISNKSNVGGCIVADVKTLAMFGGVLVGEFGSNAKGFLGKEWMRFMCDYNFARADPKINDQNHDETNYQNKSNNKFVFTKYMFPIPRKFPVPVHKYPSHYAYGLGCINYVNTTQYQDLLKNYQNSILEHQKNSPQTENKTANIPSHIPSPSSNLLPFHSFNLLPLNPTPYPHHTSLTYLKSSCHFPLTSELPPDCLPSLPPQLSIRDPIMYHTGQGLGSSAVLLTALSDGITISILGNVGLIDLKEAALDIATMVKQFIMVKFGQGGGKVS